MTDPIEQARLRLVMNSGRAPWVDDRLLEQYVAAILRYHPDVVRLVERLGAWEQWADDGCPAGLRPAALVPFTTEEESE